MRDRTSARTAAGLDPEQFAEYASAFDDVFTRADQREWFRLYVRGLLTAPERKNVEAIAATVAELAHTGGNLGQALQHFVTDSPWDHARVLARYRDRLPASVRHEAVNWAIHDGVLLKKGRNSVGTQRQFARSVDRKVQCQVAVVVGVTTRAGYVPLAIRLYLPGYWLREYPELAAKTVPVAHRTHVSKSTLALNLIDELRGEGWSAAAAAFDEGFGGGRLVEELAGREIRQLERPTEALTAASERFEWLKSRLGLDHFEGRTWTGWHHHAAMVFAATGFLLSGVGETT